MKQFTETPFYSYDLQLNYNFILLRPHAGKNQLFNDIVLNIDLESPTVIEQTSMSTKWEGISSAFVMVIHSGMVNMVALNSYSFTSLMYKLTMNVDEFIGIWSEKKVHGGGALSYCVRVAGNYGSVHREYDVSHWEDDKYECTREGLLLDFSEQATGGYML